MFHPAQGARPWATGSYGGPPSHTTQNAYIPVPARHTFSSHSALPPPPTYIPQPLGSQSQHPPPPPGTIPTASASTPSLSKTQFSDAVRTYVSRSFEHENTIKDVSRQELEIRLKAIITDAAQNGRLQTIDWTTYPLPQQIILEERKRAALAPLMASYPLHVPVPIPAHSSTKPPTDNTLRKRKSSEMTGEQDDVKPPWRNNNKPSGSLADRVSFAPVDKRQKTDALKSFSKSNASLEQRRKRFEDARNGSYSPSTPRTPRGLTPDAVPTGPVVGRSQKLEKNYFRLTAPPNPEDVRPLEVLRKTLELLKKKWRSAENYTYICDQLKSLRQDLTVQHIKTDFTTTVYETHARIALERGDLGEYNQCQTQLRSLYKQSLGGHPVEFKAYRILYFIHTRNRTDMNDVLSELTPADKQEPAIKHALDVRSALALGNYHKFFKLYLSVPGMGAYLMDMFVERERLAALAAMSKS